jgi:hypothetical protein
VLVDHDDGMTDDLEVTLSSGLQTFTSEVTSKLNVDSEPGLLMFSSEATSELNIVLLNCHTH